MSDKKDYAKLTLEELLLEEKKIKRNEIGAALMIGLSVSVMLYGIATKGFGFIYIAIPLFLISGIYKNSQKQKSNLKQIREAINAKNKK